MTDSYRWSEDQGPLPGSVEPAPSGVVRVSPANVTCASALPGSLRAYDVRRGAHKMRQLCQPRYMHHDWLEVLRQPDSPLR